MLVVGHIDKVYSTIVYCTKWYDYSKCWVLSSIRPVLKMKVDHMSVGRYNKIKNKTLPQFVQRQKKIKITIILKRGSQSTFIFFHFLTNSVDGSVIQLIKLEWPYDRISLGLTRALISLLLLLATLYEVPPKWVFFLVWLYLQYVYLLETRHIANMVIPKKGSNFLNCIIYTLHKMV